MWPALATGFPWRTEWILTPWQGLPVSTFYRTEHWGQRSQENAPFTWLSRGRHRVPSQAAGTRSCVLNCSALRGLQAHQKANLHPCGSWDETGSWEMTSDIWRYVFNHGFMWRIWMRYMAPPPMWPPWPPCTDSSHIVSGCWSMWQNMAEVMVCHTKIRLKKAVAPILRYIFTYLFLSHSLEKG